MGAGIVLLAALVPWGASEVLSAGGAHVYWLEGTHLRRAITPKHKYFGAPQAKISEIGIVKEGNPF